MVAEFGIAPNSPRLQRGANLSQLFSLREMVPPRGNAPRSIDYQSMALLLSYGGEGSWLATALEYRLRLQLWLKGLYRKNRTPLDRTRCSKQS
jgi:hypothetical protein